MNETLKRIRIPSPPFFPWGKRTLHPLLLLSLGPNLLRKYFCLDHRGLGSIHLHISQKLSRKNLKVFQQMSVKTSTPTHLSVLHPVLEIEMENCFSLHFTHRTLDTRHWGLSHADQFSNSIWCLAVHFWYHLLGGSVSSHRLRAQHHKIGYQWLSTQHWIPMPFLNLWCFWPSPPYHRFGNLLERITELREILI